LRFVRGNLTVFDHQPDLYRFLQLHPLLAGGENRDPDKMARFKEIKFDEIHNTRVLNNQLAFEAQAYIYDERMKLTDDQLKDVLSSYGVPDVGAMKQREVASRLLDYILGERGVSHTLAGPDVFLNKVKGIGAPDLRVAVIVQKALDSQVIGYNSSTRDWIWGKATRDSGGIITRQPQGTKEGKDWFAEWLRTKDTSGVLNQMEHRVNETRSTIKHEEVEDEGSDQEQSDKAPPFAEIGFRTKIIKKAMQEAEELFVDGKLDEAITRMDDAIKMNEQESKTQENLYERAQHRKRFFKQELVKAEVTG
jgi:hypothetical protein